VSEPRRLPRSNYAARLGEFTDFVFTEGQAFAWAGRWREYFASRIGAKFDGRVMLELGCSDGEVLTTLAARHPETAFVGLDWKCRPLHAAGARCAALKLNNLALLRARAQDISRIFAPREIDEIWLFHPDPCDSAVELKNRLIADQFLIDAHQALGSGGILALKTDHRGYYEWTLARRAGGAAHKIDAAHASASGDALRPMFKITVNSCNFWNDPEAQSKTASRLFAGQMTPFESRFVRKRLPIYYIEMRAMPV